MPEGFEVGLSVHERRRGTERRAGLDRRDARERRAGQRRCRDAVVKIERRVGADRRTGERRWRMRRSGDDRRRVGLG
jgi:hypothetical protein